MYRPYRPYRLQSHFEPDFRSFLQTVHYFHYPFYSLQSLYRPTFEPHFEPDPSVEVVIRSGTFRVASCREGGIEIRPLRGHKWGERRPQTHLGEGLSNPFLVYFLTTMPASCSDSMLAI
jgi:hypothetical protein